MSVVAVLFVIFGVFVIVWFCYCLFRCMSVLEFLCGLVGSKVCFGVCICFGVSERGCRAACAFAARNPRPLVRACVRACVLACVGVCVCVGVRPCVHARTRSIPAAVLARRRTVTARCLDIEPSPINILRCRRIERFDMPRSRIR